MMMHRVKVVHQTKQKVMRLSTSKFRFSAVQWRHSTSAAREGFGSFHSEDIEVLIRQEDGKYSPPAVYDEITSKLTDNNDAIVKSFKFGRQAKNGLFALGMYHSLSSAIIL